MLEGGKPKEIVAETPGRLLVGIGV